jgi:hypothetical protein
VSDIQKWQVFEWNNLRKGDTSEKNSVYTYKYTLLRKNASQNALGAFQQ